MVFEITKGVMAATAWLIVATALTFTAGHVTNALTLAP